MNDDPATPREQKRVDARDPERNRLAGRMRRYAKVGTDVGAVAARVAGNRFFGAQTGSNEAKALKAALGGLKGPLMKVAQLLATIPEALPPEFAEELAQLQSQAPSMGWPFVKRRMAAELGRDWQKKFAAFDRDAAAAASLGQVHKATAHDGTLLACKLQYPDMESAVEADLSQLKILFSIHRRMDPAIDTSQIAEEIGARLREELDYRREARHAALYTAMLSAEENIVVPAVFADLSTKRLLTMTWLEGKPALDFRGHSLEARNLLARTMFNAWWVPFCRYGVIHGDPHLGNYSARIDGDGNPCGLNLLDYGCVRIFPTRFVSGVVELYNGLRSGNRDQVVHAYDIWGFKGLNNELIDILNIWAKFIYGPLLDDRVRVIADGVKPGHYGRKEAYNVHKALKEKGPIQVPREFVFMDRAAIGLGGVFIHLNAEMNFHNLFNDAIEDFSLEDVTKRQTKALEAVGLTLPSA
jgi:predicted unusual protein kinase regulating ubiquinone biosynthesis (AarF/ABC1/UbiB family)